MLSTRIAAGATALVLGISGVALANAGVSGEIETETETHVSIPAATAGVTTETETSVAASPSTTPREGSTTSLTSATTPTTVDSTSTTVDSTATTVDDNPVTDDRNELESRSIVSLDLNTYAVGEAGTVTVNGMALVTVDANPGWTVEIEEASTDKIKIEFENGEREVEFELRVDGELRIKSEN